MNSQTKITCPNCGTEIDVQDILAHQLEIDLQKEYDTKVGTEKKKNNKCTINN